MPFFEGSDVFSVGISTWEGHCVDADDDTPFIGPYINLVSILVTRSDSTVEATYTRIYRYAPAMRRFETCEEAAHTGWQPAWTMLLGPERWATLPSTLRILGSWLWDRGRYSVRACLPRLDRRVDISRLPPVRHWLTRMRNHQPRYGRNRVNGRRRQHVDS